MKTLIIFFLIFSLVGCDERNETTTTPSITVAGTSDQYHHVDGCPVCHDASGNSTNVALIRHVIDTPNSGPKTVKFTARSGPYSFADGDNTYNGPCEVCHTMNRHHNNDGHDNTTHMGGAICTACHKHSNQFAAPIMPYTQSHRTHLESKHVADMNITCTTCHNDPASDPLVFADRQPLATTTVCNACHSPNGAYPGIGGLLNTTLGAKANFKTGGVYEADRITLKIDKKHWCASCHDESPSVINGVTAPIAVADASDQYHHVDGCPVCHDISGNSSNLKLIKNVIITPIWYRLAKSVVFTALTGPNSLADGDVAYNGPCEVCHTKNEHHNNDGSDNTTHMDGMICTTCHKHSSQFAAPHPKPHKNHISLHSGASTVCTTCHNDPLGDPLVFADMQPLATTTVCGACHGGNLLIAKERFVTGGVYQENGTTLKISYSSWCGGCH